MNGDLFGLAVQGIGRKKRSSLLLFAVLLLSFAFAIISLSVTASIRKTNEEYRYDTYGTWYGAIRDGLESDRSFLQKQEWLDKLGTCVSYGKIQASSGGSRSIGTMDGTFLEIGRISLQDGHFPENANETAIEADLLSALGYDYTIGQEITVTINFPAIAYVKFDGSDEPEAQSVTVPVEQTYILSGVIREYADLWVQDKALLNSQQLNSAMITPEAAEALLQSVPEAAEILRESMNAAMEEDGLGEVARIDVDTDVTPQYYFSVQAGLENDARKQTNKYLEGTEEDKVAAERQLTVNTFAFFATEQEENVETFFAALILAVTLLSVVCIYAVRIQNEARQLATFRSIGITKRQLCLMLLYETLSLGVPSMLLGAAFGALGTWALLRLALYSGSAAIQVVIPPGMLAAAAALWLIGVLTVRLAVFLVALRAPLTGRFHVAQKKARRYRNLQRALISCLSVLMCASIIFTVMESLIPFYEFEKWSNYFDYYITESGYRAMVTTFNEKSRLTGEEWYANLDKTVPKTESESIAQIPGVTNVWGFGKGNVRLEFDGMEEAALLNGCLRHVREWMETYGTNGYYLEYGVGPYDPNAFTVQLLVVDEDDWEGIIDFDIDMERFLLGEAVLVGFRVDANGMFLNTYSNMDAYSDMGLDVGDTIRITLGTPDNYATTEAEVGGFSILRPGTSDLGLFWLQYPYTIIASEAFLEKLLDSLGPNAAWNVFRQGSPYGYEMMYVFADYNADYMSTDAVLAQVCVQDGLQLESRREMNHALEQDSLQTIILLLAGGVCTALVLLLILWNTIAMDAERQKKNYGILQALGMSQRQSGAKQLGTALLRGGLAVVLGWLMYGGYCVLWALEEQKRLLALDVEKALWDIFKARIVDLTRYYGDWITLLLLTVGCIALVLLVSWTAKRRLTRDDLMAKLRDER